MMPKKSSTSSAGCPACWLTATAGSPVPRWRAAAACSPPTAGAPLNEAAGATAAAAAAAAAPAAGVAPPELVEARCGPPASSSAEGRPSRCGWIRLVARRMWRAASTVVGMRA